ncbi:MAG: glycosyltransferase [Thermodesulfobacteriota bacterium]
MRFLLISSVFPPAFHYGGIPPIVFGLAEAFISLGHQCQVITTNAGGDGNLTVPLDQPTAYQGVPVIYTPRWRRNAYFFAPHLIRHLKNFASQYDIALVYGGWGYINLAARLALPKLSLPYILNPQGIFDEWAFRQGYLKKRLYWDFIEKKNYLRASGIMALTKIEASLIRQYLQDVLVWVIPNGVNLDQFYPAPSREEFNQFFPELADRPYLLFLSRLHPKKGLDVLFPAFRQFIEKWGGGDRPRPFLVVAGGGEVKYRNELTRMVEELNISDFLLFPGMVTGQAKLALLHHSAFMVLPSRSEGLPMAVLEALACGKPVILTPECYLPEVAQSGAGLEVDLDVNKWGDAMAELWHSPDRQRHMGESALKLIQEKFTWKKVAEKTVQFSQELLNHIRKNNV